jgi:hypothetical protein
VFDVEGTPRLAPVGRLPVCGAAGEGVALREGNVLVNELAGGEEREGNEDELTVLLSNGCSITQYTFPFSIPSARFHFLPSSSDTYTLFSIGS